MKVSGLLSGDQFVKRLLSDEPDVSDSACWEFTALAPAADRIKKLAKRAGLPAQLTIHDCRHTALTILENNNVPLSIVQAIAGHSSAAMTRHYTDHASLEAMRRAIEKIG